jgi:hypothetical protein
MVCYSILWIAGVWKWRIVGGGEDRRYINSRSRMPQQIGHHYGLSYAIYII